MKALVGPIKYIVCATCLVWLICFPLLGGTSTWKDWFATLAKNFLFSEDKKGGVPIVMLTFPIFIAASFTIVLDSCLFCNKHNSNKGQQRPNVLRPIRALYGWIQKQLIKFRVHASTLSLMVLLLICGIYVQSSIERHLGGSSGKDMSKAKKLGEIGNSFGMMATVLLSWLLIPVTSLGPLSKVFSSWNNTTFHIWSGRLVILGSVIHGICHTWRWMEHGEDIWGVLIPPLKCYYDEDFTPTCKSSHTDCKCYYHFRNFTGLLAGIGLVLIAITSLYKIRRQYFEWFAKIHYLSAPFTILMIILHYNRAILYASGGMLYYLAARAPHWMEDWNQRRYRRTGGKHLSLTSIVQLKSHCQKRNCYSLSFAATPEAIANYRPGMYGYLKVPELSTISHPFTLNLVQPNPTASSSSSLNDDSSQLRIIFRVMGKFTKGLESTLLPLLTANDNKNQLGANASFENTNIPHLYLHGYHGRTNRLQEALQHDVVVIVAAGIGITPYLTLISQLLESTISSASSNPDYSNRRIVFHWICRDEELIQYCRQEYFDVWVQQSTNFSLADEEDGIFTIPNSSNTLSVEVIIHKTQSTTMKNTIKSQDENDDEGLTTNYSDSPKTNAVPLNHGKGLVQVYFSSDASLNPNAGAPFSPTKLTSIMEDSSPAPSKALYSVFFLASIWIGLFVTWKCYMKFQEKHATVGRFYTSIVLVVFFASMSGLVVMCISRANNIACHWRVRRHVGSVTWNRLSVKDSDDEHEDTNKFKSMVEMSALSGTPNDLDPTIESNGDKVSGRSKNCTNVSVTEHYGRPTCLELLKESDSAQYPALFQCVPSALKDEMTKTLRSKAAVGTVLTLYEETFLI